MYSLRDDCQSGFGTAIHCIDYLINVHAASTPPSNPTHNKALGKLLRSNFCNRSGALMRQPHSVGLT
jgi:hypothetical protein